MTATIVARTDTGFTVQIEVPYKDSMLDAEDAIQSAVNQAGVVAIEVRVGRHRARRPAAIAVTDRGCRSACRVAVRLDRGPEAPTIRLAPDPARDLGEALIRAAREGDGRTIPNGDDAAIELRVGRRGRVAVRLDLGPAPLTITLAPDRARDLGEALIRVADEIDGPLIDRNMYRFWP